MSKDVSVFLYVFVCLFVYVFVLWCILRYMMDIHSLGAFPLSHASVIFSLRQPRRHPKELQAQKIDVQFAFSIWSCSWS